MARSLFFSSLILPLPGARFNILPLQESKTVLQVDLHDNRDYIYSQGLKKVMQFKEHDHELVQCLPLLFYSVGAEVIRLELMEPANIHQGTTLRKEDQMRIHLATMTHLQVCF